ncbi:hypothetical protein OROMI_027928 [Orobanche minor]
MAFGKNKAATFKFQVHRIYDFEFTPERAIFDLLKIPWCHGWIVDQQDHDTAIAIGSKSYDALLEELVSLGPQNTEIIPKSNAEEKDCADFVAATTTALGVPSPSLSKTRCFDDSPRSISDQVSRKGDLEEEEEEEEELSRALEISKVDFKSSISGGVSFGMDENMCDKQAVYEGKEEITPEQGEMVNSFLRNNASQLTSYGFPVFKMVFKSFNDVFFSETIISAPCLSFEGELYLLVTDQGYINQPDLVWEKLNEEFKVENHENYTTWDKNNTINSDYLGSIDDGATQTALDINSGLQSSIALQQEVGSRLVRDWQNDSAVCSQPHETGGKLSFLPEELIKNPPLCSGQGSS